MSHEDKLETFTKQPLGGVDRRSLLDLLAKNGPDTARNDLAAQRKTIATQGTDIPRDACVLMLGGSNGILRAVAVQLVFGEKVPVYCVHYDSEKLQIGGHHARAIHDAATEIGVAADFKNADATKPAVIAEVVESLKSRYRVVHLINGIAAGATKRYEQHGKTKVRDLDVAFDPVRQVPDFSAWDRVRKVGLVEVDTASAEDIERTNKMMGHSTAPWADALAAAGLLVRGESIVAFADYDFEPDDPVYAMGPLAGAKLLQRESMAKIGSQYGVRTVRLCYPAMNTTAIGAIPGGILMFAGTAEVMIRRGTYRNLVALARDTMPMFRRGFASGEVRLDDEYKAALPEFHALTGDLTNENLRERLSHVVGYAAL
jgi:enoyl-[acyl-carrier protein] reductase/trans-2-enoyl-CoA reductase (NAD+)